MPTPISNRRPVIHEVIPFPFEEVREGAMDFGFDLLVLIGIEGEKGSDGYHGFVCSPSWLAENFTTVNPETGRRTFPYASEDDPTDIRPLFAPGLVLMPTWSPDALRREIDEICDLCIGPDWESVAMRLSRFLPWEFDYKYDEYVDTHSDQFRLPRGWAAVSYK